MQKTRTIVSIIGVVFGGLVGCATTPDGRSGEAGAPLEPVRQVEATPEQLGADPVSPDVVAAETDKAVSSPQELGVKVLGVGLTSAGYMLDFRYRVTDPDKASAFVSRTAKPCLIDQATGNKFYVPNPPKVGSLRQRTTKPTTDRTYFVLFANPSRFIKAGDKVTVAFEDHKFENLVVR